MTVTGKRARKAYAILQGLESRDAHIVLRRGAHNNEVRIRDLNHVFVYLLDSARLVVPSGTGE